jgi:hypothetical protein
VQVVEGRERSPDDDSRPECGDGDGSDGERRPRDAPGRHELEYRGCGDEREQADVPDECATTVAVVDAPEGLDGARIGLGWRPGRRPGRRFVGGVVAGHRRQVSRPLVVKEAL